MHEDNKTLGRVIFNPYIIYDFLDELPPIKSPGRSGMPVFSMNNLNVGRAGKCHDP
jgi:hypothetical protein